jgi:hypothetical protein
LLELIIRPSLSTLSSVNTSPLACGSMRTVKLFGGDDPVTLDRPTSIFQVPDIASGAAGRGEYDQGQNGSHVRPH